MRGAIRRLIERDPALTIAGEAASAEEALGELSPAEADVALLDIELPGMDGIELCRVLRKRDPDIACLMVSSRSDQGSVMASIEAGAAGFFVKTGGSGPLADAIKRVASGGSFLSPEIVGGVLDELRSPSVYPLAALSSTERKVLDALADGLSNGEIAERLGLAVQTVKNDVSSILRKLGLRSRTEAALFRRSVRGGGAGDGT